jgi:hypothetical protein
MYPKRSMNWKKRTHVVHTEAAPPRYGRSILPTIGWHIKSKKALKKSVAARICTVDLSVFA